MYFLSNFFGAQYYYWHPCLFTKQKLKGFSHQSNYLLKQKIFTYHHQQKKNKSGAQKTQQLVGTSLSPRVLRKIEPVQCFSAGCNVKLQNFPGRILKITQIFSIVAIAYDFNAANSTNTFRLAAKGFYTWTVVDVVLVCRRRRGVLENSKDASVRFGALQIKAVAVGKSVLEAAPRDVGVERLL